MCINTPKAPAKTVIADNEAPDGGDLTAAVRRSSSKRRVTPTRFTGPRGLVPDQYGKTQLGQ